MGIISFLIVGALAGWLASKYKNKNQGLFMNLLVGIAGAFVGDVLGRSIGIAATGRIGQVVVATVGALVLLWVIGRLKKA